MNIFHQPVISRQAFLLLAFAMHYYLRADVLEEVVTKPIPLKPIEVTYPWYARSEVSGYAEVLFEVDSNGDPRDFVILKSTHRAFSLAIINTIKEINFTPATHNGKPVSAQVIHQNHFLPDRYVAERKITEKSPPYRVNPHSLPLLVYGPRDLDNPLKALTTISPSYPANLKNTDRGGGVLLEFYVDRNGSVRAPKVISSSHEIFSQSAIEAIRQWKFSQPTRKGEPVTALARQQFNF